MMILVYISYNNLFLYRHQLLGDEDLGPLYDLLIDESPLIRHAVGDLVYDHLIAQKFSSSHSKGIGLVLIIATTCY